jgi:hypothetical protein
MDPQLSKEDMIEEVADDLIEEVADDLMDRWLEPEFGPLSDKRKTGRNYQAIYSCCLRETRELVESIERGELRLESNIHNTK